MKTITFKLPKMRDVEFTICPESENIPIEGNASAIDEETDRKIENWIKSELESGNIWAWCTVHVQAEWKGFTGNDYLGCCSYRSENDFIEGGYWEDMKQTAYDDLTKQLEELEN